MRRLSDYKGDDAIELWADLIEPVTSIIADKEIKTVVQSGESKMKIASTVLKKHKAEAEKILLRIDPEPLDGLNIVLRLCTLLMEMGENEEIKSFFGYAEQAKTDSAPIGSQSENTEVEEN